MGSLRVQYRERQRLLAADLRAEQDSRLGGMGRHFITHHQWGIVRGLDLLKAPEGWVLEPGVAVDGYGREIVVPQRVVLADGDTPTCWTVLLYYCEAPPPRVCQPRPPDRLAGDYRIVLVATGPGALDEWLDLSIARAAGPMPGLPLWPVTLGGVGDCDVQRGDEQIADISIARYTRARADVIRSPSGRATLQLGLQSATDLHHFLLSTANSPTLSKRLGINRDHTVHVWRPLVLTGPDAVAYATSAAGVKFALSTVMPSGINRVLSIDGALVKAGGRPSFSVVLHDSALAQPVTHEHVFAASILRPATLALPGVAHLALEVAGEPGILKPFRARPISRARGRPQEPVEVSTAPFSAAFSPAGGHFEVKRAEGEPEEEELECGDVSRTHSAPVPADEGIVVVKPAVEATLDPATRGFHALQSQAPGQAPSTELRLLGGAFDKTDASSRIALGGRFSPTKKWDPVLTMDGVGRFSVPGQPTETRLRVEQGAFYLPPVAASPSEPLFQDLQALAFLGGLRSIGRTDGSITVTVPAASKTIDDGGQVTYTLSGSLAGSTVKRWFELIVGSDGPRDLLIFSNAGSSTLPTGRTIPAVTHRAGQVRLVVVLWLTRADKDYVTPEASDTITINHPT